MPEPFVFDANYYERFYRNPRTRVTTEEGVRALAEFVCAYLKHVGQGVEQVLDMGCGLGYWRGPIAAHFPEASYLGVEVSDYLCEEYGWTKGSVVDFKSCRRFDLTICQGVLQYLEDEACAAAIDNLAKLTRGALYLEALTVEDWEQNCDRRVTDGSVHLRPGDWYRERLGEHFTNCGGGVFLADTSEAALFELERL